MTAPVKRRAPLPVKLLLQMAAIVVLAVPAWNAVARLPTAPPSGLPSPARVDLSVQPADASVELRWSFGSLPLNTSAWEYQRREADGSYGKWLRIPRKAAGSGRYSVQPLINGLVYRFRVRVANADSADEWSNEVAAVPSLQVPRRREPTQSEDCDGDSFGQVFFRLGRHAVDEDYRDNRTGLQTIVSRLSNQVERERRVLVEGFASAEGKASRNLDLSEKRAHAVVRYLQGIEGVGGHLVTMAMGEQHDQVVLDREDEKHQRVVVRPCRNEAPATGMAPGDAQ